MGEFAGAIQKTVVDQREQRERGNQGVPHRRRDETSIAEEADKAGEEICEADQDEIGDSPPTEGQWRAFAKRNTIPVVI